MKIMYFLINLKIKQLRIGDKYQFTYNYVFGPTIKQSELYNTCVGNLINSIFNGYNVTSIIYYYKIVFAYGQTNSGKTYTMGTDLSNLINQNTYGILPRVFNHIFYNISKNSNNIDYKIKVSFLEVYGEEIRDLLDTRNNDIIIHDTDKRTVSVSGCREEEIHSQEDLMSCLSRVLIIIYFRVQLIE